MYNGLRVINSVESNRMRLTSFKIAWSKTWRLLLDVIIALVVILGVYRWQSSALLPANQSHKAPPFHLPTLSGDLFDLSAASPKMRLLYFFAPWNASCNLTGEEINALQRQLPFEVEVVAIGLVWEQRKELEDFARRYHLAGPVVMGGKELIDAYHSNVFPTFYLVEEKGFIAGGVIGHVSTLAEQLKKWLRPNADH